MSDCPKSQECCAPGTFGFDSANARDAEGASPDSSDQDCIPAIGGFDPPLGPSDGGTHVTIVGICLDHVTGIKLDGQPLSDFMIEDSGHITGVTDSHVPGTVDAVFTTDAAGDITVTDAFTYTPPPPPPPPPECEYGLSPTNASYAAAGGAGNTVAVTATVGCAWTAVSSSSWIVITAGSTGVGNGTVTYTVAANVGESRQGFMTVGGIIFSVTQDGSPSIPPVIPCAGSCSYSLSPSLGGVAGAAFGPSGGDDTIAITTGNNECVWQAAAIPTWITITSALTGTGPGTIAYSVAENLGYNREGYISICDVNFKVSQSGHSSSSSSSSSSNPNVGCQSGDIDIVSFSRLCDLHDAAGEYGVFAANGRTNDYHWRLQLALAPGVIVKQITVRMTNASGSANATEVWDTQNEHLFPLVIYDAGGQKNFNYSDNLGLVGPSVEIEMYGQERLAVESHEGYFTVYVYTNNGCVESDTILGTCPLPATCSSEIPNPAGTKFKIKEFPGGVLAGTFPLYPTVDPCAMIGPAGSLTPWDGIIEEQGSQECQWTATEHYRRNYGPLVVACYSFFTETGSGSRAIGDVWLHLVCPTCVVGDGGLTYWKLEISLMTDPFCNPQTVWHGKKLDGLSPVGVYTRVAGECASGPNTLEVESL